MLMLVSFSFRASEIIFSLSIKLANLPTVVHLLFFSLLPTLCDLSTKVFSNCSFSSNKFCKISSVCSHVPFSTSAIPSILRLWRGHLSSRSFSLSQSWSLSFQSSLMSSLCFCFCLLRLSSTFWNFFSSISWDISKLLLRSTVFYWVFLTFHYCLEFLLTVNLISQLHWVARENNLSDRFFLRLKHSCEKFFYHFNWYIL